MKRNQNLKKSGISLIVLVITIIVIIILAVAVILSIANNNPISNANKARAANDDSAILEAANLAYTSIYADKQIKGEKIDYNELTEEVQGALRTQGFSEDKIAQIIVSENGVEKVDEHILSKTLQGKYIVANNVFKSDQDVDFKLSSSTITDFSSVKVRQFGANLFDYNLLNPSQYIQLQSYENGVITLSNSATQIKPADFIIKNLPAGTYTLSRLDDDPNASKIYLYTSTNNVDGGSAITWATNERQITVNNNFSLKITANVSANSTREIKNLQVQLGDKKTNYEEYVCNEFTANSDGTVSGIKSISPIMSFITDNENVEISCTYKKIGVEVSKSKVKGKKMAVIGDSISAGVSSVRLDSGKVTPATTGSNLLTNVDSAWWQLVKNRYEISEVINNSVSGASYSVDGSVNNPRFTSYLNTTALPEDLDIIMVFGGTNDFSIGRPLGTIDDAASTNNSVTFCSAVKATLEYITTHFPNAQIVYMTPIPRWSQTGTLNIDADGNYSWVDMVGQSEYNEKNKVGLLLSDYVNAIKQLCSSYSNVKVCDMYTTSHMDMGSMDFKVKYAPDGLHPNAEGTKIYVNNDLFPFLDKIWFEKIYE